MRGRRVSAKDEEEVADAVRAARRSGSGLRVVGSGGSKSGINTAPDVALELDQPDRLLSVENGLVTVHAGMTTGRLQDLLRTEGLALPTVGEWKLATVGGSMATGTHGGSRRHGILSTSVRRMRLVSGAGEVVELSPGDPDFGHVGVSLGAFGVVTAVTFQCVERFSLALETDVVPFDTYVRDPVGQESRSEFHASVWMPGARKVIRFTARRVADPDRTVPRRERFGRHTALAHLLSRRLGWHGAVSSRLLGRRAVGDCAEILSPLEVSSRVARFRNVANDIRGRKATELAVDASRASEALTRFDRFLRDHPGPLNNPIGLRISPADGFSLSPCSGRDTLWLDIFYDDSDPFVARLSALGEELEARCHWGKTLALAPGVLRDHYPRWDEFREARNRLDPDDVFANPYLRELGLCGSTPDAGTPGAGTPGAASVRETGASS